MPADVEVNTAQKRLRILFSTRNSPLRQIPAQMISRLQIIIKKNFCVSTGKWTFPSLRNKRNRDKKIVGKKVSGICRGAKAAGEFRLPSFWKRASPHTPTASFWSSLLLRMSLSLCLCNKCEHSLCLCTCLCSCLCRSVNQA